MTNFRIVTWPQWFWDSLTLNGLAMTREHARFFYVLSAGLCSRSGLKI